MLMIISKSASYWFIIEFEIVILQVAEGTAPSFTVSKAPQDEGGADPELLGGTDAVASMEEKDLHSFEIDPAQVIRRVLDVSMLLIV